MTPLWLRFAARELRSGVKGFRIFLACLALGVAAIAAAGSTAEAFRQGLATQARDILGGDISVSVSQRKWTIDERAKFAALGQTSYAVASQVRAWIDPYRSSFSKVTLETVYRPMADPSRTNRDLEQQVPLDHPVAKRMTQILKEMVSLYGRDSSATIP